ncbi:MAG: hypothetical protein ACON4U_16990 [Myxococcota bacterium]
MSICRSIGLLALIATAPLPYQYSWLISAAHAENNMPSATLLGSQSILADGSQSYTFHVLLLSAQGEPLNGANGSLRLDTGSKGNLVGIGNGVYSVSITPDAVTSPTTANVNISAKSSSRQKILGTTKIKLLPPSVRLVEFTSDPAELLLGADENATIQFKFEGGFAEDSQLSVQSSEGTISNVTYLGDNKFSALYTPPAKKLFPHVSVITVVDQNNPDETYSAYAFKQIGQTKFPVRTAPNAKVALEVGGRSFGPVQADASGQARIPIRVPPGETIAKQTSILGSDRTEDSIDLQVPSTNRIAFFAPPESIPAEAGLQVPIRIFAINAKGNPDPTSAIEFSASVGTISTARHEGKGIFSAMYQPPAGNNSSSVTITASMKGTDSKKTLNLKLIPQLPGSLDLSFKQNKLAKDSVSFSVFSKLKDERGNGLAGSSFGFISYGARINTTKDLGSGDYESTFTTNTDGSVEITAVPNVSGSQNPITNIVAIPSRKQVQNDGLSSVAVTIIALDRFGHPVADVPINLNLLSGDGSLPNSTKTDQYGFAQVSYTAGKSINVANIEIQSERRSANIQIPQVPAGSSLDIGPVFSGSAESVAQQKRWSKLVKTIRIEREGMEGSTISAQVEQLGEVSKIQVSTEPSMAAPGGSVAINIRITDSSGNGIPNQSLEPIASQGELTAIQDLGGGRYSTKLLIPDNISGEIKLSISESSGKVSAFYKIPVVAGMVTTPSEEPEVEEPPKEKGPTFSERLAERRASKTPKSRKSASDAPLVRASAAYAGGFYGYQQVPTSKDGPLYGNSITFNNQTEGSSSARTAGFDLRARGFIPTIKYLGFEGKYHGDFYQVNLSEFNDPVPDIINELDLIAIGRYPFAAGSTQLHVGGRLGFSVDDFTVYRQTLVEADDAELSYEPLNIPSAIVGLEGAIESELGLFADAYFDIGLRGSVYRTQLGANIGYSLPASLFGTAGFRTSTREIEIETDSGKVGEIRDVNTTLLFGIGYEFN